MKYTRRHFIGTAAVGAGCILLNGRIVEAGLIAAKNHDPYDTVKLGKSGIKTTRLCLGTGIRGGKRQSNLTRLGYDEGVKFVREIYDRGVRMFDTADLYGTHGIIGDALKTHRRGDYTIFTKIWFAKGGIPEPERPDAETVVHRFLKELQTDYIDGVMLHCVTSGQWNTELSDYMQALDKLKQKGAIRSHGLSCHSAAAVETAVHEPWVDCINVRFNPFGPKMDDRPEKMETIIRQLHEAGKGVIAMKVFGEGTFADDDEKKTQACVISFGRELSMCSTSEWTRRAILSIPKREYGKCRKDKRRRSVISYSAKRMHTRPRLLRVP